MSSTIHRGAAGVARSRVDGVPAFWADSPARFTAGLVFRVGQADETLARRGVTHLVEHLALPARRLRGLVFNGVVNGSLTVVWAEGDEEAVLAFVEATAATLAELPLERLEAERGILLTEAAGRTTAPAEAAAGLRFGAAGHGLVGYPELGLHGLAAGDAAAWAAERFVREAAAFYATREPSREPELPLPSGVRVAAPEPEQVADVSFPALYPWGSPGGAGLSLLGVRSSELSVALAVAEDRARMRLRSELGLSYHVAACAEPLTRDRSHVVLSADCRPGDEARAADELLRVVYELAESGPTEEELELDLAEAERRFADPCEAAGSAFYRASQELFGAPFETDAELARERAEVTPAAAAEALADALRTALLLTNAELPVPDGFTEYPRCSPGRVDGRRHRPKGLPLGDRRRAGLVVGSDGVTLLGPDGRTTVRFADCVAAQAWLDGTRILWGRDGSVLTLVPSLWRRGDDAAAAVDAALAGERVVPMEPLADRVAEVRAALAGKLERGWATREELDRLPDVLEHGERAVDAAAAMKGWRAGVLAVTDRRLLFLFLESVVVDIPLDAVTAVSAEAGSWWRCSKLVVTTAPRTLVFRDVRPRERLDELAAAVARAA